MPEPPDFEIRREVIDVTYGGLFGGRPDTNRKYAGGGAHYYVDDREVTKAEYERLWKKHAKSIR